MSIVMKKEWFRLLLSGLAILIFGYFSTYIRERNFYLGLLGLFIYYLSLFFFTYAWILWRAKLPESSFKRKHAYLYLIIGGFVFGVFGDFLTLLLLKMMVGYDLLSYKMVPALALFCGTLAQPIFISMLTLESRNFSRARRSAYLIIGTGLLLIVGYVISFMSISVGRLPMNLADYPNFTTIKEIEKNYGKADRKAFLKSRTPEFKDILGFEPLWTNRAKKIGISPLFPRKGEIENSEKGGLALYQWEDNCLGLPRKLLVILADPENGEVLDIATAGSLYRRWHHLDILADEGSSFIWE